MFPYGSGIERISLDNQGSIIENKFQSLVKQDEYQVFIFDCPAYIPFNFARHPWFVLNKKGTLSRWEVRQEKDKNNNHLYLNAVIPFRGINVSFVGKQYFWKPELLGYIEGDENSNVKQLIDFIESSKENYPYQYKYYLSGPNSNTYAQWILNKFPEFNVKLSWRFIGKDF